MHKIKQIVFASSNAGKIKEINEIFSQINIEVIPQSEFKVPDVDETGLTFIENAILKARHCAQYTSLPTLADDSGLSIDALKGAPGIYSARYSGIHGDQEGAIDKVLNELENVKKENRGASFHSFLALMQHKNDPTPLMSHGQWHGEILFERQGKGGFGYDPIFYVPTHQCSAAEFLPEIKNKISHRGQAIQKLLLQLKSNVFN